MTLPVPYLFCPLCGAVLDCVASHRQPLEFRCVRCNKGWQVIALKGQIIVSQAESLNKPILRVVSS